MTLIRPLARPLVGRLGRALTERGRVSAAVDLLGGAGAMNSSTGWTLATGVTISGGVMTWNATANTNVSYASAQVAGTYRITFRVVSHNKGNITPRLITSGGTITGTTIVDPVDGVYSQDLVALTDVTSFQFRTTIQDTLIDWVLDDVTVTRVA